MASAETGKAPGPAVATTRNADGVQTIKVSAARSVFFFVDLATKYLKDEAQIELSGLGYAITTVVTIGEILKNQGIAEIKKVQTTMASKERRAQKPKIEITLQRSANFEEIRAKKQAIADEKKKLEEERVQAQTKIQEEWKNAVAAK